MPHFGFKMPVACVLAGVVVGASIAYAAQPNMVSALNSLEQAKASLLAAEANKAGHRDRAISFVNQAITQVREGIAAAN